MLRPPYCTVTGQFMRESHTWAKQARNNVQDHYRAALDALAKTNFGAEMDSTQNQATSCRRTMAECSKTSPTHKCEQHRTPLPHGREPLGSLTAADRAGTRTTLADACVPSIASTTMGAASSAMVEVDSIHPDSTSLCIATSRSSEHAGSTPAGSTNLQQGASGSRALGVEDRNLGARSAAFSLIK